jgi:regulator of sigma E protease
VLFSLEALKGGELSLRTREVAQQIGLAFLLLLMGLAFWNDISRILASYGL